MDEARLRIRVRQMSYRTERTYLGWIRRFLREVLKSTPAGPEARPTGGPGSTPGGSTPPISDLVEAARRYLEHLAVIERLGPSTQNQAASALSFFFREVLRATEEMEFPRARGPQRRPTVLSGQEVRKVLAELTGTKRLAASLMYGSGLRLSECMALRVKDVSLDPRRITVRVGKGGKDRETLLPAHIADELRVQIMRVADQHDKDRAAGRGWARLPKALARKSPSAGDDLAWQFIFPSRHITTDPATRRAGRHHLHPSVMQRAVKEAVKRSGINKAASCHTLRHSFATHILRMGYDIQTVKELMGHHSVKTTMIYAHVMDRPGFGIQSPLDRLMTQE
ncbi:MAG: integron integrase [Gemmatimonadota bacterium]|nr:integron integrase [Gemmatimonadota bacterium]